VVTHQLQVERRTAKAHRPETDALPLDHATNKKIKYRRLALLAMMPVKLPFRSAVYISLSAACRRNSLPNAKNCGGDIAA